MERGLSDRLPLPNLWLTLGIFALMSLTYLAWFALWIQGRVSAFASRPRAETSHHQEPSRSRWRTRKHHGEGTGWRGVVAGKKDGRWLRGPSRPSGKDTPPAPGSPH
jgi:hypothetical protein